MNQKALSNCPFCHKLTIKILHIPFVANTITSKCRAGGRTTTYQRERFNILSGCDACGKTKKDIEDSFDGKNSHVSHEDRIKRLQGAGIPTRIEG